MSKLGHKLKVLRKKKNLSQEALAKELDIKRSTLSGYENALAEPNIELLVKFAQFFGCSLDFLLLGRESEIDMDIQGDQLRIITTQVNEDNESLIELVPESAKAGYAASFADPEYIKVLPTFNLPFLSQDRKYRAFPISGDSMPPLNHNDIVVAEYIDNWYMIQDGQPYVVVTKNDGIVFKLVYNNIYKEKSIELVSTNTFYDPYHVKIEEVSEIWKFVTYISRRGPELSQDNLFNQELEKLKNEMSSLKSQLKN